MLARPSKFLPSIWSLALACALVLTSLPATQVTTSHAGAGPGQPALAPLNSPFFIENAGQFPAEARFQAPAADRTLWLTGDALWVSFPDVHLRLTFPGAQAHPRLEPFNRLDTHVSYFPESAESPWRADVPVWGGVRYVDLYPGIDLVVAADGEGAGLQLESRPGADVGAVKLQVEGADRLDLAPDGLLVSTAGGTYRLPLLTMAGAPSTDAPPELVGDVVSRPFSAAAAEASGQAAAAPSAGDLLYSTLFGANGWGPQALVTDATGAAYMKGYSYGDNTFPATPGAYREKSDSYGEAYAAKLNATGTALIYLTYLGKGSYAEGDIAIDSHGAAYVVGQTYPSTQFPDTVGKISDCSQAYVNRAVFLVKLNETGTGAYYSTCVTDMNDSMNHDYHLAVDAIGNAYIAGDTYGWGESPCAWSGDVEAFVMKVNADASAIVYGKCFAGKNGDYINDIAVGSTGSAYIVGQTASSDFPITGGAFDTTFNSSYSGFAAKLSTDGAALAYSTFLDALPQAVAVDGSGAAYISGWTYLGRSNLTTSGAWDRTLDGNSDAFVAKLNPAGSGLVYATLVGGKGTDAAYGIGLDAGGAVTISGDTASCDFPTTSGAADNWYAAGTCKDYDGNAFPCPDAFVARLNPQGSLITYGTFWGGTGNETTATGSGGVGLSLSGDSSVTMGGKTDSSDFPTTSGALRRTRGQYPDGFIARFAAPSGVVVPPQCGTPPTATPTSTPTQTPTATATEKPNTKLWLTADRTEVPADNASQVVLLAKVVDKTTDAPVPGAPVSFAFQPALGRIAPLSGVTDARGELRAVYTAPSALDLTGASEVVVRATKTKDTGPLDTDYVKIQLRVHKLELFVEPYEIRADGKSQATITAVVTGYYGLPAQGDTVEIEDPTLGTVSPESAITGGDGRATFTYTASTNDKLGGQNNAEISIAASDITHYAAATTSLRLKSPAPLITKVRSKYIGTFLEDVHTKNRYSVTVDWQKAGYGSVEFVLNGEKTTVPASGDLVSADYDMGFDMEASDDGGDNVLEITAISKDGKLRSRTVTLKPQVMPQPPWLMSWADQTLAAPSPRAYDNSARYKTFVKMPDPAYNATVTVPGYIPWISGESGLKKGQVSADMEYDSAASQGSTGGGGSGEITVRGSAISIEMGAKGVYAAVPGQGWKMDNLQLSAAGGGKLIDPSDEKWHWECGKVFPPLAALASTPIIGRAVSRLLSFCTVAVGVNAKVGGAITSAYEPQGGFPYLYPYKGSFTPEMGLKGILDFKPSEEWLQFGGAGGGTFNIEMVAQPGWVLQASKANVTISTEWNLRIYKFATGGQWPWTWSYPSASAASEDAWIPPVVTTGPELTVPARQPIDASYNLFAPDQAPGLDTRLVENVYELTVPALAALPNGDLVLAWTHDDPAQPNMRGEEILASVRRGGVWQAPVPITADSQPDWHPVLAVDGSGKVLAVWERSHDANLTTDTPLATYVTSMEVAYSVFNPTTGAWSAPALLTNDNRLDQQIKLAIAPDGRIMAAWVSNGTGELIGTAASPDTIRYAIWSGSSWTAPADLATNLAELTGWGIAYRGDAGIAVLARDLGGTLGDDADTELFRLNFDGAGWSAPLRITSDAAADASPQPFYRDGQPWLLWDHAGQLMMKKAIWAEAAEPVLDGSALEHATLRMLSDATGRLAVTWTGYAGETSTLFYSRYDTDAGWSSPVSLVTPPAMTSRPAPAFGPDGLLQVAYLTTEIIQPPAAAGAGAAPQTGRKDLHIVAQPPFVDLALSDADLAANPTQPAPGQSATLSAVVHNQGDQAVRNVSAAFFDGNPASGGTLIGATQQIPLLAGKSSATVNASWTAPQDGQPHTIFAVVDPNLAIAESDETNNRSRLALLLPAPRFIAGQATTGETNAVELYATIENAGGQTLSAAQLRFEDVLSGKLIARVPVADVPAGQTMTVHATWDMTGLPAASYPVIMTLEPSQPVASSSTLAGQTVVALQPNLAVGPEDIAFRVSSNLAATLLVRIHNTGPRGVENVPVALVLGTPGQGGSRRVSAAIPSVPAGGSAQLELPWRSTGGAPATIYIDPDGLLTEVERADNAALIDPGSQPSFTGVWLPLVMGQGVVSWWRTPTPIPPGTATRTSTPTRTPTPTGTLRPTYTATAAPATVTPTATPTVAMPTSAPTRNGTATPTPSITPSATPSRTTTATPSSTPSPSATPGDGWTVLLSDGFEGPTLAGWTHAEGSAPKWGRTNCKAFAGSYAIWPASGSTCADNYPNNAWSLLIAGPYDLSDAATAEFTFKRWQRTELDYDTFWWLISLNGEDFFGWQSSGDSQGWKATTYDLTDFAGLPQVWIAFGFQSDSTGTDLGVWVDDVVLRKK